MIPLPSNLARRVALGAAALAVVTAATTASGAGFSPERPECIAPANPGGGWDTICRTTAAVLQRRNTLKSTMYVSNMPGGSGAVAIANVVTKRKGDGDVIVAASNSLSFTMAAGRTPHTYADVIPIAQIAAEYGGFFVRADSKLKTLGDLVAALKANPASVSFAGGSAPGSFDHVKTAVFAKAIGVDATKLVYVPFQGGGEAITALLGGHTDIASIDLAEASAQLEAGKIRCLGIVSDKRSSKHKDLPTTYEQGVKVSFPVWRGFYMAPGASPEAVKFWTETVKAMVASPEWVAERERLGWEGVNRFGDEFATYARDELQRYQALLKELGFVK
ncbi:Bug family tripartite tricarboxylate transporter substrate binding protein [Anaeromyxobacter sp. SG26]|uniref:Bug family tripartite tricarboxylate transporter substrate binding protein n=1 Tax=Anaeromyxobacter sp. SG26 TaxID=2925407 RepID=UPI001F5766F9|nr:tripartite tricarboxylate transporter substrate binding protein [Anaeromyxobacter sp. SG26]